MKIMSLLFAAVLISLPVPVHAATETRHYRGEMEFVSLSGASCGDKIKPGDRIPINLVVKASGESIDGYYAGQKILTGHFAGRSAENLSVSYSGENPSTQQGNRISLHLAGDRPSGDIREKPLATSEPGCNFDLARLVLVPESTGKTADSTFDKLAKRFQAEYENSQATQKYDSGNMQEAIRHFESEIKLLEDIEGVSSEALIDPLLILSVAYCASERFDKGKELQDRVFAIPMGPLKRKIWRVTVMQKLFAAQAERLAQDGATDKAIALLEKAVATYPDLTGLYYHMAEIMIGLREPEEACLHVEKAWSEHRDDSQLRNAQALCLLWKGKESIDPDEPAIATALFKQAWQLKPDDLDILVQLGGAYIANGEPDVAIVLITENAEQIIKEIGPKEYERLLAVIHAGASDRAAKKKEYTAAESELHTALGLDPLNTSYTLKLASVVHKAGRYVEALQILEGWRRKCSDAVCREQTDRAIEYERQLEMIVKKISR